MYKNECIEADQEICLLIDDMATLFVSATSVNDNKLKASIKNDYYAKVDEFINIVLDLNWVNLIQVVLNNYFNVNITANMPILRYSFYYHLCQIIDKAKALKEREEEKDAFASSITSVKLLKDIREKVNSKHKFLIE